MYFFSKKLIKISKNALEREGWCQSDKQIRKMYSYFRKISSISDCDEKKLWWDGRKRRRGATAEEEGRKVMRGIISKPKKSQIFPFLTFSKHGKICILWHLQKYVKFACHFWPHPLLSRALAEKSMYFFSKKLTKISKSALERRGGVKSDTFKSPSN